VADVGAPAVVVASDAFKGSLTSLEVADAVRLGVLDVAPSAGVTVVAVADGGEGTVAAALAAGWSGVSVDVSGPTGQPVTATLAVRGGATVVVELADCCGLGRLPGGVPAPLTASSRGLGEALRAALDLGPVEVVVGVGGSASTDGGAGMLVALGARLLDADGQDLPDGGGALAGVARLDLSGLDPRLAGIRLVLAADVDSPLLGPTGAAAVFGPQKGATPADVAVLEAGLTRWAAVAAAALPAPSQQAGAGAAGGVGFALLAVLGAERRPGVDVVLDLVGLDTVLTGEQGRPDLVITGEGALDEQTLSGKAVAGVARAAAAHGIPVVAVCGRLALDDAALATLGVRGAYPLSDLEPDPARSVERAAVLLRHTARRVATEWLSPPRG
jgi:glycerate kinase